MGHSALVVDPVEAKVINATGYNNKSCYEDVSAVTIDPAFIILRPKADADVKAAVVEYANNELFDLYYTISIGVLSPKFAEKPVATNCSHLIWQAYKKFGFDLDSNGGKVVLPMDFAASEHLEIVQIRGIDPATLNR